MKFISKFLKDTLYKTVYSHFTELSNCGISYMEEWMYQYRPKHIDLRETSLNFTKQLANIV